MRGRELDHLRVPRVPGLSRPNICSFPAEMFFLPVRIFVLHYTVKMTIIMQYQISFRDVLRSRVLSTGWDRISQQHTTTEEINQSNTCVVRTTPSEILMTCDCAQCHNVIFHSSRSASRSTVSPCVILGSFQTRWTERGKIGSPGGWLRLLPLTMFVQQRDQENWQMNEHFPNNLTRCISRPP